jgi:hypothetical protein
VDPPTNRQRKSYKYAFIAIGFVSVGITGFQQVKHGRSEAALERKIDYLTKATGDVQQQTKTPPTVNVTVPPPIVQIISPPAPSAKTQKIPPPAPPSNIRLSTGPTAFLELADKLGKAHVRGLDLLERAREAEPESLKKEFLEWAGGILNALNETRCWASAYIMNSDVGLTLGPISEKVPEQNREIYYNIRFREYRLEQLMSKLQAAPNACP